MSLDLFKRRALRLEYFTVGYNVLEGIASVLAGYLAGSPALTGFGLDSAVESASGVILIWRLKGRGSPGEEDGERMEKKAVLFVGLSFLLLGAYVLYESVERLYFRRAPLPSAPGIVIALLSIAIMPVLALKKYRIAREIGSRSLLADSKETLVCALLSAALIIGLGLNYFYGIWWADPLSALVIAAYLFWEGVETVREGRE